MQLLKEVGQDTVPQGYLKAPWLAPSSNQIFALGTAPDRVSLETQGEILTGFISSITLVKKHVEHSIFSKELFKILISSTINFVL